MAVHFSMVASKPPGEYINSGGPEPTTSKRVEMPSTIAVAISGLVYMPRIDGYVDRHVAVLVANLAADQTQRFVNAFEAELVRGHRFEIDLARRHQFQSHLDRLEAVSAHAAKVDRLADHRVEREPVDRFAFERGRDETPVAGLEDVEPAIDHFGRAARRNVEHEIGAAAVRDLGNAVAHRLLIDGDRIVRTELL